MLYSGRLRSVVSWPINSFIFSNCFILVKVVESIQGIYPTLAEVGWDTNTSQGTTHTQTHTLTNALTPRDNLESPFHLPV